jgi:hypothetical protein
VTLNSPIGSGRGASDLAARAVYTTTIFLSALLLFAVQPMLTKMVLPTLGGSPSVWAVSLCFFQGALLLGYCYAFLLHRLASVRSTVVLHVAPEATAGGPLALVQNGDLITLDVPARSLHLHVSDDELAARRAAWVAPEPHAARGYQRLYIDHVLQADRGADFDFLVGRSGSPVPRDNH